MHDQFDDRLSGRIRDVFDNFDDGAADQGWKELRKRFPGEKERKVIPMWWWQSAAVIFLALGTWAYFGSSAEKNYLGKAKIKEAVESVKDFALKIELPRLGDEGNQSGTGEELAGLPEQKKPVLKVAKDPRRHFAAKRPRRKSMSSSSGIKYYSNPVTKASQEDLAVIAQEEQRVVENTNTAGDGPDSTIRTVAKSSSINSLERMVVADMLQKQKVKNPTAPVTQVAKLSEEKVVPAAPEKKSKKVSLGITAGSYMSYAKGSEGSVNTGVGVLSEIAISKKLKISTGLSLAQNTLKFSESIPQEAQASFYSSAPQSDMVSTPAAPGLITTAPVSYSLNKYNASLLGLDLPVNLKYSVLKQKRELYFLAGLSSNFFIEENYTYSYQMNSGSNSSTKQEDDNAGKSRFQNFDLARMLNLSIGLEQPLTKQSRLSFEPFLKYPLGGQGARDIRFGSVGMNLKLNLNK